MTLENNTVTQREHPAFEDDYIAPHRHPSDVSDRLAFAFVKALRFVADRFFADRYGHRAVVLETVAAVPGTLPSSWDSSCASELKTWPLRSIAITVKPNANTDRWRDMNRLLESCSEFSDTTIRWIYTTRNCSVLDPDCDSGVACI